jgi:pectinesterase
MTKPWNTQTLSSRPGKYVMAVASALLFPLPAGALARSTSSVSSPNSHAQSSPTRNKAHIIRPGYLTAQSRISPAQNTGYVFLRDRITAGDMGEKTFFLVRTWRPFSRVVFLSSELPVSLSPQGWSSWTKDGNIDAAFYAQQDDTGPGARPKDRLLGSHQLTAEEATQFMPEHFLAGSDHWNVAAEAAKLP